MRTKVDGQSKEANWRKRAFQWPTTATIMHATVAKQDAAIDMTVLPWQSIAEIHASCQTFSPLTLLCVQTVHKDYDDVTVRYGENQIPHFAQVLSIPCAHIAQVTYVRVP